MSNSDGAKTSWARYIKEATERPGWSGARLARESGVNRTTIYRWINGEGGNVTVDRVRRIAVALGDDPVEVVRRTAPTVDTTAAPDQQDEAIAKIMRAPVDDDLKQTMLRKLAEQRERARQEQLGYVQDMIDLARGGEE